MDEENKGGAAPAGESRESISEALDAYASEAEPAEVAEEIPEAAGREVPDALVPLRELLSPRAFFRRTFKLDTFSVLSGDNKYKLEVLSEIYSRRDFAFRYACIYCAAMLVYCMVVGFLAFNMTLARRGIYFEAIVPQVGFATILPIFLVFIPAVGADFMKQAGVLLTVLVFMIFTGVYIVMGYYIFVPFTLFGAYVFLRQNAVLDLYAVLAEEDGFPEFSDFTFEHKRPTGLKKETD
jgi:hypothetical protein